MLATVNLVTSATTCVGSSIVTGITATALASNRSYAALVTRTSATTGI